MHKRVRNRERGGEGLCLPAAMHDIHGSAGDVMEAVEVALGMGQAQYHINRTLLNSSNNLIGKCSVGDKLFELVQNFFAKSCKFRVIDLEGLLLGFVKLLHLRVGEHLLLIYELAADAFGVRVGNPQQLGGLQDGQAELNLGDKKLDALRLLDADISAALDFLLTDDFLSLFAGGASERNLIFFFLNV